MVIEFLFVFIVLYVKVMALSGAHAITTHRYGVYRQAYYVLEFIICCTNVKWINAHDNFAASETMNERSLDIFEFHDL